MSYMYRYDHRKCVIKPLHILIERCSTEVLLIVKHELFYGSLFFLFFFSPDFYKLWHRVMSICLFTEVEHQWDTLILGLVNVSSALLVSLMALLLMLVDQNPFRPCFIKIMIKCRAFR